jgi:hypothetical protein
VNVWGLYLRVVVVPHSSATEEEILVAPTLERLLPTVGVRATIGKCSGQPIGIRTAIGKCNRRPIGIRHKKISPFFFEIFACA